MKALCCRRKKLISLSTGSVSANDSSLLLPKMRIKQKARKSTGMRPGKRRRSPSPTPEQMVEYYLENHDWVWMYTMVTLRNVGGTLRPDQQTPDEVMAVLATDDNAYTACQLENLINVRPHIMVGRQRKADDTHDMYVMIGVMVSIDTGDSSAHEMRRGLTQVLARPDREFSVADTDIICMRQHQEESDTFVQWNQHIIQLMDESAETGEYLPNW